MGSKFIFAKALLLCCASLVGLPPVYAQEAQSPEEINEESEFVAGVRHGSKRKASFANGNMSIGPDRSPVPEPAPLPPPVSVSSKLGKNRNVLERAYLDAFNILAGTNQCSKLLGGRRSITVLNELVKQLGGKNMPAGIAMQMSGPTTTYQSHMTGFTYRLFARADLNLSGLFFRGNFMNQPRVPSIGGFPPNTREARVTVLLHELGHLLRGSDKMWLLPDDGENEVLSIANTSKILDACRSSIKEVIDAP